MKTALTAASVLSWINLIVWGLIVVSGLFLTVPTGQLGYVSVIVLLSSVPLSCYAAIKLHASIRHPDIPLSHQTPTGIRFVGLMALFFGITYVGYGVMIIGHPQVILEAMKVMPDKLPGYTPAQIAALAKAVVIFVGFLLVILGLMVAVNVVLNLRLLRWYYLMHKSDAS
jgi:hypothetical protein